MDNLHGRNFKATAIARGFIYEDGGVPKVNEYFFNFYINSIGNLSAIANPLKLAELVLLTFDFEDTKKLGVGSVLLQSRAVLCALPDISVPFTGNGWCILWDTAFSNKGTIGFKNWLIAELEKIKTDQSKDLIEKIKLLK